jgi:DNA-binding IclR family transcriptional regulator
MTGGGADRRNSARRPSASAASARAARSAPAARTAPRGRATGGGLGRATTSLQVLDRTFALLSWFTADQTEWSTTELARACGLPIPTAHRILATLLAHGLLARDERTKRFRLGAGALALGERARAVVDVRSVALPVLRQLSQESGETALLTVLNGARNRSVCLERVESSQPLRLAVEPGRQLPLHAGASQKVLLAFMPEEEVDLILTEPLEQLWRATITEPKAVRADTEQIRRRGWATSFEETNAGAWGLAVPVLDQTGGVVAGVGLAGPSARLSRDEANTHLERLHSAAAKIAATLGLRSPTFAPDGDGAPWDDLPGGERPRGRPRKARVPQGG